MVFQLASTAILEHFAAPIVVWETTAQKVIFTNSAALRLFKTLDLADVSKLTIWDFIADIDYSTIETNSPDFLRSLNMKPTSDEFPVPTEGFMKLRRADSTEFISYIYIHDITDDSNVVTHRLAEIIEGYDQLAENAQWEDYFQIRETYAIANFAGDIASQLNNGLAALAGILEQSGESDLLAKNQSLKSLKDIAQNLTGMANRDIRRLPFSGVDQSDSGQILPTPLNPNQLRNRILVVDDDVALLEILGDLLTDNLLTVFIATSAAEAMAIAESNELDAALIDLRLGNENGRDVATNLKKLNNNLHIVYMTGYAAFVPRIRRHENYEVLKKPFTISDALLAINKSVG
jgi:CheY-like chemotaxis protein